jgi:hypothetical protein
LNRKLIAMIPAGYMAKRVVARPDAFLADRFEDVCSVSNCISPSFADYIQYWKHNAHWFFDSTETIRELAAEQAIDLRDCRFFYYEFHDSEYDDATRAWNPAPAAPAAAATDAAVAGPSAARLEGYDVVSMWPEGSPPGCSPLSCNLLADTIPVNSHCLIASLEEAIRLLEAGAFEHSEPGPYRIYAVYSIE